MVPNLGRCLRVPYNFNDIESPGRKRSGQTSQIKLNGSPKDATLSSGDTVVSSHFCMCRPPPDLDEDELPEWSTHDPVEFPPPTPPIACDHTPTQFLDEPGFRQSLSLAPPLHRPREQTNTPQKAIKQGGKAMRGERGHEKARDDAEKPIIHTI